MADSYSFFTPALTPERKSQLEAEYNAAHAELSITGSMKWFWGVLQGDFNENPTMGQIIVGTIITLVPGLDTAGDVRDVIANLAQISDSPEDTMKWLALAITVIGFIPEFGSMLKGAFKGFIKNARKGGDAAIEAIKTLVAKIRAANKKLGVGYGDPIKYLKNIDWDALTKEVLNKFKEILHTMQLKIKDISNSALSRVLGKNKMAQLKLVSKQLAQLEAKGFDQIPKAMKYLRNKINELLPKIDPEVAKGAAGKETVIKNTKADLPLTRAQYEIKSKQIGEDVASMRKAGKSEREIAEYAEAKRRAIQKEARQNTDPEIMELISARNKDRYNHPDGPDFKRTTDGRWSYEKKRKGSKKYDTYYKTDKEIADAAGNSGGGDFAWDLVLEFTRAKRANDLARAKVLKEEIRKKLGL
ncbi:hypothetical protein [Hydromonas duriensis]|uniref:Uncharacterized protein n=1 Tax=Hydromonas duriensis TaxID=1527608 RepID=A0A4R6Y3Z1_9BURK|nr:hypothetical protein [Hydromonas duriensis]TDR27059.1 hypothetical protein DFR44_1472 [Hydromonas duriensis]